MCAGGGARLPAYVASRPSSPKDQSAAAGYRSDDGPATLYWHRRIRSSRRSAICQLRTGTVFSRRVSRGETRKERRAAGGSGGRPVRCHGAGRDESKGVAARHGGIGAHDFGRVGTEDRAGLGEAAAPKTSFFAGGDRAGPSFDVC